MFCSFTNIEVKICIIPFDETKRSVNHCTINNGVRMTYPAAYQANKMRIAHTLKAHVTGAKAGTVRKQIACIRRPLSPDFSTKGLFSPSYSRP